MRSTEIKAGIVYEGGSRLMRREVLEVGKGVCPAAPTVAHVRYRDVGEAKGPFYLPLKSFAEWARRVAHNQTVPVETPVAERRYVAKRISEYVVHVLDRRYGDAVTAYVHFRRTARGEGWVLYPQNAARNPSRKMHATPAEAISSMRYMKISDVNADLG